MNKLYKTLRVTLSGQFAAQLRTAATNDKRTIRAFLETYLPTVVPFADAKVPPEDAKVPPEDAEVPPGDASSTPPAISPLVVPPNPALPARYASDTDQTGWTDAEIDTWSHTDICPLWRPGLALPV